MAAPLLTRKSLIVMEVESAYGTDATPQATTGGLLTTVPSMSIDSQVLDRIMITGTLSPTQPVMGRTLTNISFQTELKSQNEILDGVSSNPLELNPLLRMAGFKPTYTVETSAPGSNDGYVTYNLVDGVTNPFESVTLDFFSGNQVKHKIRGAYANLNMEFAAGNYPIINAEVKGLYDAPTDATSSTPGYATDIPRMSESLALAFGAVTGLVIRSFSINLNNEIIERPDVNSAEGTKGLRISGRRPTASFVIEKELMATWNPYTAMKAGTTYALTFTHGSTAGQKILVTIPKFTLTGISESDDNGIAMWNIDGLCARTTADDELTLKFF